MPKLPEGMKWRRDGIKYLGVYLGDEDTERKNWDGVEEKIKAKLDKWKWLLPFLPSADNKQSGFIYVMAPACMCRATFQPVKGNTKNGG